VFEWLEGTAIALWVGESLWGYPIMLSMHAVGLAIVVGIFVMRDLRLLGRFEGIRYGSLERLVKLGWVGFVINAISGVFLFTSQATIFISSTPFLLKIAMIFIAAILGAVIQTRVRGEAVEWDQSGRVAVKSVRVLASISIALWAGAIISGRLVAYL
jgi:hypothetical protein